MADISTKAPPMGDSEEAEILACRKALEFSINAGFSKLAIEGNNANVMGSITSTGVNQSRLGYIIKDIQSLAHRLSWMSARCV